MTYSAGNPNMDQNRAQARELVNGIIKYVRNMSGSEEDKYFEIVSRVDLLHEEAMAKRANTHMMLICAEAIIGLSKTNINL